MEELTLIDCFAIVRRWKKLFLIVTATLLAISLVCAARWANYRSTAVVQIEQADISSNATLPMGTNAHDAAEALADQRISEIQQRVLSTASLIEIITKFDLYHKSREKTPIAFIAEGMRKKIKIDLVSGLLANPAAASKVSAEQLSAIAFRISFDYSNPLIAQQVTDDLVSRFLDEDLKQRRTQTQETSAFLANQIALLEASLLEQEKKIADYQKEHGVSRPESLAFNQQAAITLSMNLQNTESQITSNEGNLGSLRAQLANIDPYSRVIADGQVMTTPSVQMKALQAQYATLSAQYGPEHPDVVKIRHQIEALHPQISGMIDSTAPLKAKITDIRTNLDAARKTYGEEHPDVIALKSQLQKLENQLATSRPTNQATGTIQDADNPAYLQAVAQLHAAEEQHKALIEQRKALQDQQMTFQKAIIANPEAEKEMAALTRDYDNAQLRFRELKEKKMSADMDEQMQKDRKGQRMSLIDPPELPLKTQPAKFIILFAGIVLSLLGGLLSVVVAQSLFQGIVGAHHLQNIVGVQPLATIPHIYTQEERERTVTQRLLALRDKIEKRLKRQ